MDHGLFQSLNNGLGDFVLRFDLGAVPMFALGDNLKGRRGAVVGRPGGLTYTAACVGSMGWALAAAGIDCNDGWFIALANEHLQQNFYSSEKLTIRPF